jgi:hypothetical protein
MQKALAISPESLASERHRVAAVYNSEDKPTRRGQFFAWQAAGLELLKGCRDESIAAKATHVWLSRYQSQRSARPSRLPFEPTWLEEPTFFTELRRRPKLRGDIWPEPTNESFELRFQEQELRRELLASMVRLGHASIDLYVLAANQLGSLKGRARPRDESGHGLITEFLRLLEDQSSRSGQWRAFQELADAAANFDAILDANLPEIRQQPLAAVGRELGVLLTTQQPVGGMSGGVNHRLVRQFRMPGYPCVLFTTDVLQEGEDLHLFCSRVYHYGLSWTPSSMEQRVGRIDRVRSRTHRELEALVRRPGEEEKLQVFYPHLRETVEAHQTQTVLERLNRFLVLMHKDLKSPDVDQRQLNMRHEVALGLRDVLPITAALTSAFPVPEEYLGTSKRALAVDPQAIAKIAATFAEATSVLPSALGVTWLEERTGARTGIRQIGNRRQAFSLFLRSVDGYPCVRCVSPIGTKDDGLTVEEVSAASSASNVRVSAIYNQSLLAYEFAVEGDVLLWTGSNAVARVESLVSAVTEAADCIEARLLEIDPETADVERDLVKEPDYAR